MMTKYSPAYCDLRRRILAALRAGGYILNLDQALELQRRATSAASAGH